VPNQSVLTFKPGTLNLEPISLGKMLIDFHLSPISTINEKMIFLSDLGAWSEAGGKNCYQTITNNQQ